MHECGSLGRREGDSDGDRLPVLGLPFPERLRAGVQQEAFARLAVGHAQHALVALRAERRVPQLQLGFSAERPAQILFTADDGSKCTLSKDGTKIEVRREGGKEPLLLYEATSH